MLFQQWGKNKLSKLAPIRTPGDFHEFINPSAFHAFTQNIDLVPTWSQLSPDFRGHLRGNSFLDIRFIKRNIGFKNIAFFKNGFAAVVLAVTKKFSHAGAEFISPADLFEKSRNDRVLRIGGEMIRVNQAETDRYWNAIVDNGGMESECGWCKDKWGLSWQITPRVLMEAMAKGADEAKRAFEAMLKMGKIDVAKIEAAARGEA